MSKTDGKDFSFSRLERECLMLHRDSATVPTRQRSLIIMSAECHFHSRIRLVLYYLDLTDREHVSGGDAVKAFIQLSIASGGNSD
jgi:hypothetical protein